MGRYRTAVIRYNREKARERLEITGPFDQEYEYLLMQAQQEQAPYTKQIRVIASKYIPKLWDNRVNRLRALGKELNERERKKIRAKLDPDCASLGWTKNYLTDCLPKEAKDPVRQKAAYEKHKRARKIRADNHVEKVIEEWIDILRKQRYRTLWLDKEAYVELVTKNWQDDKIGLQIDLLDWKLDTIVTKPRIKPQQTIEEWDNMQRYVD